MAAPLGNTNNADGKRWKLALHAALERRGKDKWEALTDLAEKLLTACEEGQIPALRELGDRMDGKPAQQIIQTGPDDGPVQHSITVKFSG